MGTTKQTPQADPATQSDPNDPLVLAAIALPPSETPSKSARRTAKKEDVAEYQVPTLDPFAEELTTDEVNEVVVTIGPRQKMVGNKVVDVEPATTGRYTIAFWQSLYRDEKGDVAQFTAKLEGYPIYEGDEWVSIGPITEPKK